MLLCGMVAQASTGLTDYSGMLVADLPTHGDASEALQALIDECPNMTIYIPAGTYTLYNPIRTSAVPTRTVALQLDDNAVLKAAGGWNHSAPMITLGTSTVSYTHLLRLLSSPPPANSVCRSHPTLPIFRNISPT